MTRKKVIFSWVLALVLTLALSVYQRLTGPTQPVTGTATVGGKEYLYKFTRSHAGEGGEAIKVETNDNSATAEMKLKRYPSHDSLQTVQFVRMGNALMAELPHQPTAGKLQYQVFVRTATDTLALTPDPVVIRFRGDVPDLVLLLHILVIFSAMLFSTKACIDAFFASERIKLYSLLTVITLFVGGFILGPIVQKYAFDAFWTGWPFGHDLTDNKTAFALVIWAFAYWRISKQSHPKLWAAIAGLALLAVFLVPHSLFGSELDYTQMPNP